MYFSKKRSLTYLLLIAAALLLACCLRFVFHPMTDNALAAIFMMTLRWAIQVPLTILWCLSIHRRILNTAIRKMLLSAGMLLVFWQIVRIIKYDYVVITEPIGRYCWYAFYVAMILVPLIGVFVVDHIGKPEGYRSPRWMKYLFIPALILLAIVFTNDLHQWVFTFPNGFELYNSDYGYGFMYIAVMGWFITLALFFAIGLMVKSRVPGSKRFQRMPLLITILGVLFWGSYSLGFIQGDLTAVDSLIIIMLLESAIQSGLIPSNMNYKELFSRSTIAAQIVDEQHRIHYASANAEPLSQELMCRAEKEAVDLGHAILQGQSISGGYVFWQDDVRIITELTQQLSETTDLLGERYDMYKAELALKERRLQAEEKSRLYDRIAREIAGQLNKAEELLEQSREHPDKTQELLSRICVISAYIKRRANLILLGEEKRSVSLHELASCLRESLDNLRLCGVITYLDCNFDGQAVIKNIIAAYDLFEKVLERLMDLLSAMMVTVEYASGVICLRIQAGCKEVLTDTPSFILTDGRIQCDLQDQDLVIEATFGQEGDEE